MKGRTTLALKERRSVGPIRVNGVNENIRQSDRERGEGFRDVVFVVVSAC